MYNLVVLTIFYNLTTAYYASCREVVFDKNR